MVLQVLNLHLAISIPTGPERTLSEQSNLGGVWTIFGQSSFWDFSFIYGLSFCDYPYRSFILGILFNVKFMRTVWYQHLATIGADISIPNGTHTIKGLATNSPYGARHFPRALEVQS